MKRGQNFLFTIVLLIFATVGYADAVAPYRTWTSTKGATIEALLVRQSGDSVILKNKEGKQLTIYLPHLSQPDQDYVSEVAEVQRAAAEKRRSAFFAGTSGARAAPTGATRPDYLSEAEHEVIKEMNLARTDPRGYAKWLTQYRSRHVGNNVFATDNGSMTTKEGLAAVDEAIKFLETCRPLDPIKPSEGLTSAARDHANDIGDAGIVGHTGSTGSTMVDRIQKHGTWQKAAGENIYFGPAHARTIVVQFIIDDGVPGRAHRENIFNNTFRVAGVAIGPHARYKSCCVIDYAGGFSD